MNTTQAGIPLLTVSELQQQQESFHVIDVRTPIEFQEVHATGAVSHPLDGLDPKQIAQEAGGKRIAILCLSGKRAEKAAEKLAAAGVKGAEVVQGGTEAWVKAGHPVERAPLKVLPLMRQVQVVVGFFCLTGSLLAHFVHPAFMVIPGFFGAGLLFAGLTGFCGLAVVLARMPWNRVEGSCCGTSCSIK